MNARKLWLCLIAVIILSFSVVGYYGYEIYRTAPPIPEKLVSEDGEVIFTKADKLTKKRLADSIESYKKQMLVRWEEMPPYFISSSSSGMGQEEILNFIEETNKIVSF